MYACSAAQRHMSASYVCWLHDAVRTTTPTTQWLAPLTVLRMRATARSTWSRAPDTVMVRSGSEGVSSLRDCTRMEAPESLMKSRTVCPLWPMSRPHRRRESASLTCGTCMTVYVKDVAKAAGLQSTTQAASQGVMTGTSPTLWVATESRGSRLDAGLPLHSKHTSQPLLACMLSKASRCI